MRIHKLISTAFLFVLFISCSEDDGNTNAIDQEALIGTWEMIALNADTEFDGTVSGFPLMATTNSTGENFNYVLTFTETTYEASGSYDVVTNGTANGEPIEAQRETVTDANERGTYEIVDGELIIDGELFDFDEANSELEGVELDLNIETTINSNGELVVEQSGEVTIQLEEGGDVFDVALDSRIVFRKQQ